MPDEIDERIANENFVSPAVEDTESNWIYILELCRRQYPIGYGVLDSFLSGPDLVRRMALVEGEVQRNPWLKGELQDTLNLAQSRDWTKVQLLLMRQLAGID